MQRIDGRENGELRPVKLTRGVMAYAEGSCLIEAGFTHVLCTATVEEKVPPWLKGRGQGWVTAEYSMLPRSCRQRIPREKNQSSGRTMEIQRLVGRSLRAVVDMTALGERTIWLDCDVLQGDGGTRTAAVSGACVALADACRWLKDQGMVKRNPLTGMVAAVSVGYVNGEAVLDLCYEEDSRAAVDMNIIMTDTNRFVEVQGTAEGLPFDRNQLNALLDLAQGGIRKLMAIQKETLEEPLPETSNSK